jgi:glycyl-tRNA synthetase
MEIEYFVKPDDSERAFEEWLKEMKSWTEDVLKIDPKHLVYKEISAEERAFYSKRTVDIEYLYPFGQKELYGLANRTDYDLSRHQEFSGEDLRWLDPETNEKILPHVVEPTWGLSRTVLAVLAEHLDVDEAETTEGDTEPRMVLRLPPRLAPVKAAVLPLQKKDGLADIGRELAAKIRAAGLVVEYDESGSIGKRYRRQDEIGTPWCFTVDYDTKENNTVTVRDRDAMTQDRIKIDEVVAWIQDKLSK